MRLYPQTSLDIGINETRANFERRLQTESRHWSTLQQAAKEAQFQSLHRDIEMATTVAQLRPVLLELLQEAIS